MSEQRPAFPIWKFRSSGASEKGKKPRAFNQIRLYKASSFRSKCAITKRNTYPSQIGVDKYWLGRYRLMVNGRWLARKDKQYCFFTINEAAEVAERLLSQNHTRELIDFQATAN